MNDLHTPQPIRSPDNNLRLQQEFLMKLRLLIPIQSRLLRLRLHHSSTTSSDPCPEEKHTYQQQNRHQLPRLSLSHSPQPPKPILPKHPRRPTFHKRDPRQLEQVRSRSRLESIAHVLQARFEHAPVHFGAELDHACGEAFADLG